MPPEPDGTRSHGLPRSIIQLVPTRDQNCRPGKRATVLVCLWLAFQATSVSAELDRVEPERGASEAGVPVRPYRKQVATIGGKPRVEIPPEPPPIREIRWCRDAGHPRNGERRDPHVIERPTIQQHPAEPSQVTGGAKQTGRPIAR